MREYLRLMNALNEIRPRLNRTEAEVLRAARRFIHTFPGQFNNAAYNHLQTLTYANHLGRRLKYNKGKVIGRIVGNRMTNPHTGVGRRFISRMMARN